MSEPEFLTLDEVLQIHARSLSEHLDKAGLANLFRALAENVDKK